MTDTVCNPCLEIGFKRVNILEERPKIEIDYSTEIWKDIPGYEGMYQASDCGRIRGLDRIVKSSGPSGIRTAKGSIMTNRTTSWGYLSTTLTKEGKGKNIQVHRLVALTFIENPENKSLVNHKDGNKINNLKSNLEWATYSENTKHAFKIGLVGRSGTAKKVMNSITGEIYDNITLAASKNNIKRTTLIRKLSGKTVNNTTLKFL